MKKILSDLSWKDLFYLSVMLIGFLFLKRCSHKDDVIITYDNALEDSLAIQRQLTAKLHETIDSAGVQTVRKEVLYGDIRRLLYSYHKNFKNTNEQLDRLMKLADKNTLAIASINSEVTFKGSVKNTIIDSTTHTVYKDQWIDLDVRVGRDSSDIALAINNKFDVQFKKKKKGLFAKNLEYECLVRNLNPYSRTSDLQSYVVKTKQNRYGIGISGGYALTTSGLSPYIGIGLQYNIIKF